MSAEQENFEQLKKLLALKRHEVPPPGFFDHLAGDVRARIRAGEHQQDLWTEMGEEASWLQKLWAALAARPSVATACGVAFCGVVLGGIYLAQPAPQAPSTFNNANPIAASISPLNSSTNGSAILPGTSLFDKIENPVSPVNFAPSSQ